MNKKIYIILIIIMFSIMSCDKKKTEDNVAVKTRLISLVPSLTDFVCKVKPESLVGISTSCDAECVSDSLPRVGGYAFLDYEKVLALKPSAVCVLKGFTSSEQIKRLNEFNISIKYFENKTLDDVMNIPVQIDSIKGEVIKKRLLLDLESLKKQKVLDKPTYQIFIGNDPIQVYGNDNYLTELFEIIGFENGIDKKGFPILQSEYFVNNLPEIIISSDIQKTKQVLISKFEGVLSQERLENVLFVEISQNQLFRSNPDVLRNAQELLDAWNKNVR